MHAHTTLGNSNSVLLLPGLELFGTERVGDVFYGVTQAVGKVIGWVDAPANMTNCTHTDTQYTQSQSTHTSTHIHIVFTLT